MKGIKIIALTLCGMMMLGAAVSALAAMPVATGWYGELNYGENSFPAGGILITVTAAVSFLTKTNRLC